MADNNSKKINYKLQSRKEEVIVTEESSLMGGGDPVPFYVHEHNKFYILPPVTPPRTRSKVNLTHYFTEELKGNRKAVTCSRSHS